MIHANDVRNRDETVTQPDMKEWLPKVAPPIDRQSRQFALAQASRRRVDDGHARQ